MDIRVHEASTLHLAGRSPYGRSARMLLGAWACIALLGGCTGEDSPGPNGPDNGPDDGPDNGPDGGPNNHPDDGTPDPGTACELDGQTHMGEGTYYDADGSGNCSFPASPDALMVAAMNELDYDGSAVCGACIAINGPNGSITVRIVDRCPECQPGDVDLSPQAFERIAPLEAGRVPISWQYVACEPAGPIVYHFKEGSNQWWTAVQVRNHRYPIDKLEYQAADGSFRAVPRESYNYFVEASGMGPGPYTFRVTDVLGNVLEDTGVPFVENGDSAGKGQFPACTGP